MKDMEVDFQKQIRSHFQCDKRYVKRISRLIVSLLAVHQSALSKWSRALSGEQKVESKYKQLQRFVRFFRFSPRLYSQLIWQMYGQEKEADPGQK
jgi:hypothetical protein